MCPLVQSARGNWCVNDFFFFNWAGGGRTGKGIHEGSGFLYEKVLRLGA